MSDFAKCANEKCKAKFNKAMSNQDYCTIKCKYVDLGVVEFYKPSYKDLMEVSG